MSTPSLRPHPLVAVALAALVTTALAGCAPSGTEKQDDKKKGSSEPQRPKRTLEDTKRIAGLEAELAALKRARDVGPAGEYKIVNAHEHMLKAENFERYLPAARKAGVVTTVVVASPLFTLFGTGE